MCTSLNSEMSRKSVCIAVLLINVNLEVLNKIPLSVSKPFINVPAEYTFPLAFITCDKKPFKPVCDKSSSITNISGSADEIVVLKNGFLSVVSTVIEPPLASG